MTAIEKLLEQVQDAFREYAQQTGHCFNYALLDIDAPETDSIGKHFEVQYGNNDYCVREVKIDQKELDNVITKGNYFMSH